MARSVKSKGMKWFGAIVVVFLSLWSVQAQAEFQAYNWWGPAGGGIWSVSSYWNPVGVPGNNDDANLTKDDSTNYIIYYYTPPAGVNLRTFNLNNTGSGSMNFYHGYWGDSWVFVAPC